MYQFDAGKRGKRFHLFHRSCRKDSDLAMTLVAGTEAHGSPVDSETYKTRRSAGLAEWQNLMA